MSFKQMILAPSRQSVFSMDGYMTWDCSLARDADGLYHLYGSRWSSRLGMNGWLTDSTIIHAIGENLTGPFQFKEELDCLKEQPWCRHMTHNARIHVINGAFYLFYIGTHYGDADVARVRNCNMHWWVKGDQDFNTVRFNQRIGLARSEQPGGPWTPCAKNPILCPRPGEWDAACTNNPSIAVLPGGKIFMIYKSTRGIRYGVNPIYISIDVNFDFGREEGWPVHLALNIPERSIT